MLFYRQNTCLLQKKELSRMFLLRCRVTEKNGILNSNQSLDYTIQSENNENSSLMTDLD